LKQGRQSCILSKEKKEFELPPSRKEHLVDIALDLFYREGFHSTGIDKILAESGVAKMTLYKHFRSKNDLILAALQERDRRFREWFFGEVESRAETPEEKLLAVFDALGVWLQGKDFRGCMFINAAAEFSSKNEAIHGFAGDHKRLVCDYLQELAKAAGVAEPSVLAFQLNLLVEGAIVMAHVGGETGSAEHAKVAAVTLIEKALAV
jgi:AcrR family transcriptional regulator